MIRSRCVSCSSLVWFVFFDMEVRFLWWNYYSRIPLMQFNSHVIKIHNENKSTAKKHVFLHCHGFSCTSFRWPTKWLPCWKVRSSRQWILRTYFCFHLITFYTRIIFIHSLRILINSTSNFGCQIVQTSREHWENLPTILRFPARHALQRLSINI